MRIAGIVRDSIVDGPGVRDVIFTQGCPHHCSGCHNQNTWDMNGGEVRLSESILRELSDSQNDITISGGEPLSQWSALLRLLKLIHEQTDKRVWLYTGYTVDLNQNFYKVLARYVDVIVDGKFVEELKDPDLLFRGSSNQRLVDIKASVECEEIIEWEECD